MIRDDIQDQELAILILNYNGAEDTINCIDSILSDSDVAPSSVLVVDNASTDDSVVRISDRFPSVTILRNGENQGYAEGFNKGIRWLMDGRAMYFLLLNNDTIVHKGAIRNMLESMRQCDEIGIVGPAILHMNSTTVQSMGFNVDWCRGRTVCLENGSIYGMTNHNTRYVDCICGCAMMISREVFDSVGYFPSHFGFYSEEADLCQRARRHGFQIACSANAVVEHKQGSTFDRFPEIRARFVTRNQLLLTKRHGRTLHFVIYSFWLIFLDMPFQSLKDCERYKRSTVIRARWRGVFSGFAESLREQRIDRLPRQNRNVKRTLQDPRSRL